MTKRLGRPPLKSSQKRSIRYTVGLQPEISRRFERALETAGNVQAAEWFYQQAVALAGTVK